MRFLKRILLWLGTIAVLTACAMVFWMAFWGDNQDVTSLKWLQFLQTAGTFLLPPILCAWMWDEQHQPFAWLQLTQPVSWQVVLWAIAVMVCAIPAINLLADLNSRITFPDSLASIELYLKQMEEAAAKLTERFLKTDNIWDLFVNLALMALLPAMAEEFTFRGTIQQLLSDDRSLTAKSHLAVWITAFIFSAIHMQFYGFIPRMLMGALFGYVLLWTGSLWVPILMHFTNNAMAVVAYFVAGDSMDAKNYADTLGAGTTWWLGVLSLIIVSLLVYGFTSQGLREYVRRTRTQ